MSIFKKNLEKNAVKKALNEIQINLENNYKDLAIKAYNDAAALKRRIVLIKSLMIRNMKSISRSLPFFTKEWKATVTGLM